MEDVITDRNITASLLTNGDGKIATISKKYKFEIAYDAKKRHLKKPILSTLDIIISVFIVGPCVVGFWRGTWQLMDFHARFFPPWESFFFGVFIHVGFIMFQDTFQEIFVKHQGMTFFPKALHFVCLRIYTYFFAVVCNMHWRGGWALFDHYLKVQFNDYGVTLKNGSCTFIMVFVGCFLMILLLKSLINCIAPPFCISLDKSRNTFTIRTRFKAKIVFIVIQLFDKTEAELEKTRTEAEKIVSTQILKEPPKPFANVYQGDHPAEFSATTEKIATVSYPQLTNYNPDYPKSIQDVIGYANANRYNRFTSIYPHFQKESMVDLHHRRAPNFSSLANDPFHSYKPQDPGDINLLAMNNLRFSPPVWTNLKKRKRKFVPMKVHLNQENSDHQEITHLNNHQLKKPISVILNIYPDQNHNNKEFITKRHKLEPMVIHLNLFPDGGATGESRTKIVGRFSTIPPL